MRTFPAAFAILLAACGGGGSSGAPLSPNEDPPEIVFCRSRSDAAQSDTQIRSTSVRGLGDSRVIDRPGVESGVRLAPDGNRLAFARERDAGDRSSRELFTGTFDGTSGELRLTVDGTLDDSPAWSPDGSRIVFSSERLGQGRRLFLIRPDGSDAIPLYDDGTVQSAPDWSWSTGRIAFARIDASGRSSIWWVDGDGRLAAPVTDGGSGTAEPGSPPGDHDPTWSPDGTSIVFARDVSPGRRVLARVTVASGVVDILTPPDGAFRRPRWSPRGDRLFFVADRPGAGIEGGRLWVAKPDGSERAMLFVDRRHDFLGFDTLPGIPPAPVRGPTPTVATIDPSRVSNAVGRRSRGRLEDVVTENGAVYGIESISNGTHQVAGLEMEIPLPVGAARDALAVELTATVAVTEVAAESIVRLAITNFSASRNDTVVEQDPGGTALRTLGFEIASLQHVSRDGHVRLAVLAQNPDDRPMELLIDALAVRVWQPPAAGEAR